MDVMTAKAIDNQLNKYWPLLEKEEKQSMLTFMKSILKFKTAAAPQRISIEQYNKEIDDAMERVKGGEFYSHEEVVEMSKKW
jgi:hypothetical protein